jgi:hypothetical protein
MTDLFTAAGVQAPPIREVPWRIVVDTCRAAGYRDISTCPNQYATADWKENHGEYDTWAASLQIGRSYLVGSKVPMCQFISNHKSRMPDWQQIAYLWCLANPHKKLLVQNGRKDWSIGVRGEYVELGLPHHDAGGERHWISQDGRTKILVNVD